jgi:catechol 2,3-dioxygenase-like lactoylglutathione lyase family enzyme
MNGPSKDASMSIEFKTPGIHHIALRSTDLARSKQFYAQLLGFPLILEKENSFIFLAGSTAIAVRGPETATPKGDVFNPFRVGLDHLALACTVEAALEPLAVALTAAGVRNTGVKLDTTLNKRYVAFKDPDGISWELFMQ